MNQIRWIRWASISVLVLFGGAAGTIVLPARGAARLSVGTVRGFPGRTVEVAVSLRYGTNDAREVAALQADVIFDATGVTDGEPVPGEILTNHVLATSRPTMGTRRLLVYSPAASVLTNGEVARIPFSVGPNEYRNFALRLTNVILVRADASQVLSETADGAIAVNQVYLGANGLADGFLNVATNGAEQCYIIQATTDFRTWVNVQTNTTEESLLQFTDPDAAGYSSRFYRAILCQAGSRLQLGVITQLPGGEVQFDFTAAHGGSYVIQASTNLTDWENIRTNVGTSSPIRFIDSFMNFTRRFYRVRAE